MKRFIIDRTAERFEEMTFELKVASVLGYLAVWVSITVGLWP